ncbi:MAG TPA: hypothetical protein VGP70_09640 [Actinomadura sp.]|nr:hypothetical protein [Actinomadura sp.]
MRVLEAFTPEDRTLRISEITRRARLHVAHGATGLRGGWVVDRPLRCRRG